jgi:tRNA-guanine family transglycosylase
MGKLVNFCAGADPNKLPAKKINALLVNVPDHGASQRKIEKAQKMFELSRPEHVILDSGGFQLLMAEEKSRKIKFDHNLPAKHSSREINLTPRHVMEAAAILNPDIVVGLDFPIGKIKEPVERQIEFIKKLEYNVPWALESAEWHKKLCPEAKFFLPIQCYDLEQLDIFLRRIDGLYFDGVSMPVRGLDVCEIALFMTRFYQLRITRVHLLGTYSFLTIALGAYMARHLFDWVSLDATSWRFAADHAEYFNLCDLSRVGLGSNTAIEEEIANHCPCQYCNGQSFNQIKNVPFKQRVALLRGHNWYAAENCFRDLYKNSENVTQLQKFLKTRSRQQTKVDELVTALSLVEILKDADVLLIQELLGGKPKKRKPSRTSRWQTVPA